MTIKDYNPLQLILLWQCPFWIQIRLLNVVVLEYDFIINVLYGNSLKQCFEIAYIYIIHENDIRKIIRVFLIYTLELLNKSDSKVEKQYFIQICQIWNA